MKHAILVEYKGGGYSGCFWEWNYFAVINNEFHNIFATGTAGVKDFDDAKRLLHDNAQDITINQYLYDNRREAYIYSFNRQADIDNFTRNSNPGNIIGVLQYLTENNLDDLQILCPRCKQYHGPADYMLDPNDYRGDGGMAICFQEFHCQDCQEQFTCPECNEYMSLHDMENRGKYDECPSCKPDSVREEDYTEEEASRMEDLEKELVWLQKDYLQWSADFDRPAAITTAQAALDDYENDIAYRHDDRYKDNED